jgi:hypothetical protein
MRGQRYAERDRHPSGPYARSFRRLDDSRREVDPTAKVTIETTMATAPGALAPATRSPRNATFPVMKAEMTLPRARKLIASTAPDETVNAFSSRRES